MSGDLKNPVKGQYVIRIFEPVILQEDKFCYHRSKLRAVLNMACLGDAKREILKIVNLVVVNSKT